LTLNDNVINEATKESSKSGSKASMSNQDLSRHRSCNKPNQPTEHPINYQYIDTQYIPAFHNSYSNIKSYISITLIKPLNNNDWKTNVIPFFHFKTSISNKTYR